MTDADLPHLLETRDVAVTVADRHVLRDVNFVTDPGESWTLVGGSHLGKSLLLRVLAGLDRPSAGSVLFRGEPVARYDPLSAPWKGRIAYVSQNLGLRANMTALENTALPLLYHGSLPAERAMEAASALLARLGVENPTLRPALMTPGERALVALARALVLDPDVLLLDDPVVVLDLDCSEAAMGLLGQHRQRGLAVVATASSETVAKVLSGTVRRLKNGYLEESE
jgi:predicted ABC-type transport system involved in lysophospholipase L1 biosynthesis ATPase subunit